MSSKVLDDAITTAESEKKFSQQEEKEQEINSLNNEQDEEDSKKISEENLKNQENDNEEKISENNNVTEKNETEETEFIGKEQADYREKLLRKIAEFENYKKRTNEEFLRLIKSANEDLITKLLPILDDINRFYKNYHQNMKAEDIKKGFDLISGKLKTTLEQSGLKAIDSIGEEFDPNLHEALLLTENKEIKPNHIIDEHEKGYFLNDKIIRHAKVIVSKNIEDEN